MQTTAARTSAAEGVWPDRIRSMRSARSGLRSIRGGASEVVTAPTVPASRPRARRLRGSDQIPSLEVLARRRPAPRVAGTRKIRLGPRVWQGLTSSGTRRRVRAHPGHETRPPAMRACSRGCGPDLDALDMTVGTTGPTPYPTPCRPSPLCQADDGRLCPAYGTHRRMTRPRRGIMGSSGLERDKPVATARPATQTVEAVRSDSPEGRDGVNCRRASASEASVALDALGQGIAVPTRGSAGHPASTRATQASDNSDTITHGRCRRRL